MGLLRTARALFSQKKAVSRRQREDQPEAGGSRDQTRYRRGVTTRVEWIQMWWANHEKGGCHGDESASEKNSE